MRVYNKTSRLSVWQAAVSLSLEELCAGISSLRFYLLLRLFCFAECGAEPSWAKPYVEYKLFALGGHLQAAARHEQCQHENQAAGVDVEIEALHFATAAAQEQDDEQDPCAIAASAKATAVSAAAATAVVKQTVEHSVPPFSRSSVGFCIDWTQSTTHYVSAQKSVTQRDCRTPWNLIIKNYL